jgi:hypothetical protein
MYKKAKYHHWKYFISKPTVKSISKINFWEFIFVARFAKIRKSNAMEVKRTHTLMAEIYAGFAIYSFM